MNEPTDRLNPDIEAEFPDVIERLDLPHLRLRSERRALVLAAFEKAQADANLPLGRRRHSAWGLGLAAALVAGALILYATFVPPHVGTGLTTGSAPVPAAVTPAEDPALQELNVALAIVNARTAAAERELAWLAAMRPAGTDGAPESGRALPILNQ